MRIGVLGGGQLGLMLAEAGEPLGLEFRFLDPSPEAPAGRLRAHEVASFDDHHAIDRFAREIDLATFEFENVGAASLERLARAVPLRPGAESLRMKQDRLVEKEFLVACGIEVPRLASIETKGDLRPAIEKVGVPAILKTRRFGYDGKGQAVVADAASLEAAWRSLGAAPCILEARIDFAREVSALLVRGLDGETRAWPLVENLHRGGILRRSIAPAPRTSAGIESLAVEWTARLAERLDHVGVLALELFETRDGRLLANEFAPRVHNSGHWTIEGARTSQFENHLRAVAGMPLGSTEPVGHAVMINLIGEAPDLQDLLVVERAAVHLYGKSPRPGRKLGHVTVVGASTREIEESVRRLEALVATARVAG